MNDRDRQNFADNLNRKVKNGEYPPTYSGEVQEIKKQGHVVVARRAAYNSMTDRVEWCKWEVY